MKKVIVIMLMFCIAFTAQLTGIGMENLYDMVVPMERDQLVISGDLPDVLSVSLPLGGTLTANIGVEADYYSMSQTVDSYLMYDVNGSFRIGTTQTRITLGTNRDVEYRLHGLDISSLSGFLAAGGDGFIGFSTSGAGFRLALDPYIGVGIGRQHSVFNILRAELMMKYLGVSPTEAKVRAVAEVFSMAAVILNEYSDNNSERVKNYWNQVASAMGIPDRVMDVIFLASSQEYAFELNRYRSLKSGMEAMLYLSLEPVLDTSLTTPFSFGGDIGMSGAISGFFVDDVLYYQASGSLSGGFSGALSANLNLLGNLVYFPDDYHWWAEAGLSAGLNIGTTTTFALTLTGDIYYMLTPNFTTYAEASLSTSSISIKAGGSYRLW